MKSMKRGIDLDEFKRIHPLAPAAGIKQLYRYYRCDDATIGHLEQLFVGAKQYHSLARDFNDPFECRPHWTRPKSAKDIRSIRQRLVKLGINRGMPRKLAEKIAANAMRKPRQLDEELRSAVVNSFRTIRICSYTAQKTNLLMWSHYANSHRGICVEFNAAVGPIALAMKVSYQDKYPQVLYPVHPDSRALQSVLIKSTEWAYEEEFRSVMYPGSSVSWECDGTSYVMPPNAITAVIFGVAIEPEKKRLILEMLQRSQFKPKMLQAKLSSTAFKLDFEEFELAV